MKRGIWRLIQLALSLVVLAAAVWVLLNHQLVLDRLAVWQYQPSGAIERLAQRAKMTDEGKFYFYASLPQLSDRAKFNQECVNQEEHAVILGCYVGQRIFVYDVTDERLDGVKEVTAAHEMLHAAYDRLTDDERQQVKKLLEAEAAAATPEFQERLKVYDSLKDADKINELHSIIGTEMAEVSAELEKYYSQYFDDRAALVALFHSYEGQFKELRDRQEALVDELNALAETINTRTEQYNQAITALNSDIDQFNQRAEAPGGFSSQAEFEQARAELQTRQAGLEQEFASIETQREAYNQKVSELNELNVQQESLQQSLDSSPSPVPAVE